MILIHIASLLLNQIAAMSSGGGVQPDLKWNGDALVCWFKQQTSRLRGHIQVLLPTNTFEANFGIKLSIWWRLIIWAHCRWTSRHGKLLPNCMTSPEDARPLGPRPTPERLVSFLLGSTIAEKRGYTVKPYHLHKLTTDLFRNLFAFMPCAFFFCGEDIRLVEPVVFTLPGGAKSFSLLPCSWQNRKSIRSLFATHRNILYIYIYMYICKYANSIIQYNILYVYIYIYIYVCIYIYTHINLEKIQQCLQYILEDMCFQLSHCFPYILGLLQHLNSILFLCACAPTFSPAQAPSASWAETQRRHRNLDMCLWSEANPTLCKQSGSCSYDTSLSYGLISVRISPIQNTLYNTCVKFSFCIATISKQIVGATLWPDTSVRLRGSRE